MNPKDVSNLIPVNTNADFEYLFTTSVNGVPNPYPSLLISIINKKDPEYDEWCDPENPRKVKYEGILAASKRILGQIVRTPLQKANMSTTLGMDLYMKEEFLQITGCFKERGVVNTLTLLSDEQKKFGVAAASTGNHACALAYHSARLGIPSVVYMPVHAPINKVNKAERQGGKIVLHGSTLAETKLFAMVKSREKRMMYVNGYDHPNIIEGQGTIGIEVIEQLPTADAVLVPCGGGSLLAGIAIAVKHLKPDIEVYGVVTDHTNSMVESLKKNERVFIPLEPSIADGLSVNKVGVNTFFNLKGVVDKMVVVREDWVARAIMHIIEEEKVVVEGAGAVGIAAILAGLFPNLKGKKVVTICSGGNIDSTTLSRALERGMSAEGRLVKFKVTVSDRPGGLADLCGLLSNVGITMRDCVPERAWVKGDVFSVQLKVIVETRGWAHTKELMEIIKKNYKEYFFQEMGEQSDKMAGTKRGPCLAPNPMCMQK